MSRQYKILIGIATVIIGAIVISKLLSMLKEEPIPLKKEVQNRYIHAERVNYDSVYAEVISSGRLKAFNTISLSSEVGGRLLEGDVTLKAGFNFKKGQVLASISNPEFYYQTKARKSQLLQSLAAVLPDLKIDFPESVDKWNAFFADIDVDKALPEFPGITNEREKIFLAARNLLNEYYTVKANDAKLVKHTLIAPFDGTFKTVAVEPGSVVNSGSKIAIIVRTDIYEVEVPIGIEEVALVKVGDKVIVNHPNSNVQINGVVHRVSSVVNEATQSVSTFIRIQNRAEYNLLDGLYVGVNIKGQIIPSVMEMPRNALVGKSDVYLVSSGKLTLRNVNILKVNAKTLLFNGISEGEYVVMEPLVNVTDNANFKVLGMENKSSTKNKTKE